MEKNSEILISIKNIISQFGKKGITSNDIGQKINLERHTLSKYLNILNASGEINMKKIGNLRLWYPVSDLADINAAVFHSKEKNEKLLAEELSSSIKKKIYNPKYIIVFITHYNDLKKFLKHFTAEFSKETKIFGCTVTGPISSDNYCYEGVSVIAIEGNSIEIGLGLAEKVKENPIEAGKIVSQVSLDNLSRDSELVTKSMFSKTQMCSLLFADGFCGREEDILLGVLEVLQNKSRVFGGSGGDFNRDEKTYIFIDDKVYTNSILMATILTDSKIEITTNHGWKVDKHLGLVNKAEGRRVYEINNQSASKYYADILGIEEKELIAKGDIFDSIGLEHPFATFDLHGEYWLRHPRKVNRDGSMEFFSKVPKGVALSIAHFNKEDLLDVTRKTARTAKKECGEPVFGFVFNCYARKQVLNESDSQRESAIISNELGCPYIGFFAIGEQSASKYGSVNHKNQSINFCLFSKQKK